MASSTTSSVARTISRLSMPITPPTVMLRSGSPTASSTSAPRRAPICGQVDADGLDPADYPVPNISASVGDPARALAEAEVRLSASVVTSTRIMRRSGRVHWSRVSSSILYEGEATGPRRRSRRRRGATPRGMWLRRSEATSRRRRIYRAQGQSLRICAPHPAKRRSRTGRRPRSVAQDDRVPALRERAEVVRHAHLELALPVDTFFTASASAFVVGRAIAARSSRLTGRSTPSSPTSSAGTRPNTVLPKDVLRYRRETRGEDDTGE